MRSTRTNSSEDIFERESNISRTLKEARLEALGKQQTPVSKPSLKHPTRPFTPANEQRSLFDNTSRPSSAIALQQ